MRNPVRFNHPIESLVAFVRLAGGDAASPCTANDGVQALRIVEAATQSLHEHRPVRVEEIANS